MADRTASADGFWNGRGILLLWWGVLAGPIAWSLDQGTSYALVKWACGSHGTWLLHLVSAVAVVVLAAGAAAAWWCHVRLRDQATLEGGGSLDRSRFMALLGLVMNGLFLLVLIANAVPRFVLSPCQ